MLATGGGTADRTIKIWNAANGKCLNSVNTGSQVCSLIWNKNEKELLSSHGFSENQLCLWKYPSMERLAELKGHTGRVLYMCQGPTGTLRRRSTAHECLHACARLFTLTPSLICGVVRLLFRVLAVVRGPARLTLTTPSQHPSTPLTTP